MINTLLVALGAGTFALAGAGQAPAAKPAKLRVATGPNGEPVVTNVPNQ